MPEKYDRRQRRNAEGLIFSDQMLVVCAKLLGVWLQIDLGVRKHVDCIMHSCNLRIYLLTLLKRQGLSLARLQCVFA